MSFCWMAMSAESSAVKSADPRDDVQCFSVKQEYNAAKHENTGRHHRRRVDECADGRWAFHCVRQPDVQWKLRGFADLHRKK